MKRHDTNNVCRLLLCLSPLLLPRQMWEAMPFDFGDMIMKLAKNEGTSAELLRNVIWAQRALFPALRVDRKSLVNIFIVNWEDIAIRMFRVLVETSVSSRSVCMSEEHCSIIDARVLAMDIDDDEETSNHNYQEIRDLITNYAHLHREYLLEATTILELALWKAVILRSRDDKQELTRAECRTDAGRCAEVVIKGVLTFL